MSARDLLDSNPVHVIDLQAAPLGVDEVAWAGSVHVLDTWVETCRREGRRLPRSALRAWVERGLLARRYALSGVAASDRPEPLGAVVDPGAGLGLVVPLQVTPAEDLIVEPWLPCRADAVQAVLQRLGTALPGGRGTEVLPEQVTARITSSFPRASVGPSMDLVAALGALASTLSEPPLTGALVALLELDGPVALRPVAATAAKTRAIAREVVHGGLLIRHPDCADSATLDPLFEEVWCCADIEDLAMRLDRAGWFAEVLATRQLSATTVRRLTTDLDRCVARHDHDLAASLARRLTAARWDAGVSPLERLRIGQSELAALRHLGRAGEALERARVLLDEVGRCDDVLAADERATVQLECAACLYDTGETERLLGILEPWCERIAERPDLLRATTRAAIWNTVARARIAVGADAWEPSLRASLDLQQVAEPGSRARTRNYLIEGLLRSGRLDDAEREMALQRDVIEAGDHYSRIMLDAHRADLARRRGECWDAGAVTVAAAADPRFTVPLGLYELQVARQAGRARDDAVERLGAAELLLRGRGEPGPRAALARVAALCAAELRGDQIGGAELRRELRGSLAGCLGVRVDELLAAHAADVPIAERLATLLPWLG